MANKRDLSKELKDFNEEKWLEIVRNEDSKLLYAPHVDEKGLFFNPWLNYKMSPLVLRRLLRYIRTEAKKVPDNEEYELTHSNKFTMDMSSDNISFLGHSSFAMSLDGEAIITDPFFSKYAFVLKRSVKVKVDYNSIPDNPVVLISHSHYDHLDNSSVKRLAAKGATFVVPLKVGKFLKRFKPKAVHELDWWESITLNGIKYTLLPSQHWSSRIGQKINGTLWGSFLIEGSRKIYFSGDSGYFVGYKEYGKVFPDIDIALLGVGAYYPRWQRFYQHQSVDEFFMALEELNAKIGIPMHYGVFRLGRETVDYPGYEVQMKSADRDDTIVLRLCDIQKFDDILKNK